MTETETQDEEAKVHLLARSERFRDLSEQHALLTKQVERIESKPHVTEDDEREEQRLKKLKLQIKDQMNELLAHARSALAT